MSFLGCRCPDSLVRWIEFGWLGRARWHDLVESQSTILGLDRSLGGEVLVGFDLILEVVLLEATGITRCFGGRVSVASNVVF